jgi:hypothetical protein
MRVDRRYSTLAAGTSSGGGEEAATAAEAGAVAAGPRPWASWGSRVRCEQSRGCGGEVHGGVSGTLGACINRRRDEAEGGAVASGAREKAKRVTLWVWIWGHPAHAPNEAHFCCAFFCFLTVMIMRNGKTLFSRLFFHGKS